MFRLSLIFGNYFVKNFNLFTYIFGEKKNTRRHSRRFFSYLVSLRMKQVVSTTILKGCRKEKNGFLLSLKLTERENQETQIQLHFTHLVYTLIC